MAPETVTVNRAPVLTLWAAVVAERLGFDPEEALSLGKAVAGLTAQTKGRSLGIYKPAERGKAKKQGLGEEFWVELCGRPIPAKNTEQGIRAVVKDKPVDPAPVQRYLSSKFGEHLSAVRKAMESLAEAFEPEELEEQAFRLYGEFRPAIASGVCVWGQKANFTWT